MLKKLWSWIVFEWKYPYGSWKKVDRDIREAFKADAVLQAIRDADVGDDVVIHNEHGMVWMRRF